MITRRKFLATSAMGLWLPTGFGASPIMTRRMVLSKTESAPDMLWQTTKVGLFNPTITKTGLPVEWDYGDGSARELTNAPSHTYAATGIKNVGIRLRDSARLVTAFDINTKDIVGTIPSLTANTALVNFYCYTNQLTGSIPSLTANTALVTFICSTNQLTGSIPSFTANTALVNFYCYTNQLTNYTASTIALTCVDFRAYNNLLPQSAVDQIAADFAANIASRPATGVLNVGGTGNATPSAAGVANFALVAARGWVVTTN